MLVAENGRGEQVLAWRVPMFSEENHCCPECREPVFIKDGPLKITHFSHYPRSTCSYGTGEGPRHVALKMFSMQAFEAFDGVAFEKRIIPDRRADVVVPSARIVVECQASAIKPSEWLARTQEYSEGGYSVLWVWDTARLRMEYNPKEILLCHRVCYGQLTACDPESGTWYSAHLESKTERGYYIPARRRPARVRELPDNVELIKTSNLDGLRVVNLTRPWWTKSRTKAWAR